MTGVALYHYTCRDHVEAIRDSGIVRPGRGAIWTSQYAWFTDMAEPDAEALGLTSHMLDCDRTEYRFQAVSTALLRPALDVIVNVGDLLSGDPTRWWVSPWSVRVVVAETAADLLLTDTTNGGKR